MGGFVKKSFLVLFFVMLLASIIINHSSVVAGALDPNDPCYGCSDTCRDGKLVSCSCISEECNCANPEACGSGLVCKNGACVGDECDGDDDCADGQTCSAGVCGYSTRSYKAVFRIKNEAYLAGLGEEDVDEFKCAKLSDVMLISPGNSEQITSGGVCCGSNEVICGLTGGSGGADDIQGINCCKVFSFSGEIVVSAPGSWVDPPGTSDERQCNSNQVAVCAGYNDGESDGLGRIKCASVKLDGVTASVADVDSSWSSCSADSTRYCGAYNDIKLLPCNLRTNAGDCGASPDHCLWCPVPTLGQPLVHARPGTTKNIYGMDYPFLLPGQTPDASGNACVDIRNGDPFNCGGCGFRVESNLDLVANSPFNCFTNVPIKPYCKGSACVGTSERASPSPWAQKMSGVSPFFYYTVEQVEGTSGFRSVPKVGGTPTGVAYDKRQRNSDDEACEYFGGTLDEDYGCCGDNKIVFTGMNCEVNKICDGYEWHDARDESSDGEVFSVPYEYRGSYYPIADINQTFSLCVDEEQYDELMAERADSPDSCAPGYDHESSNPPGAVDYYCPAGYYFAGGNHIIQSTFCQSDHVVDGGDPAFEGNSGYFVCAGEGSASSGTNTWGQAYLLRAGREFPFQGGPAIDGNLNIDATRCPSAIGDLWYKGSKKLDLISTIGCPGSVPIGPVDETLYAGPFSSLDKRMANVCLSKNSGVPLPGSTKVNLGTVNFYNGVGRIMGNVSGHGYACFTDKSKPEPEKIDYDRNAFSDWDSSRAFIGICCGNTTAGCSDIPGTIDGSLGKMFRAGEFFNTSGGPVYCLGDGRWAFDLDAPELQATCKAAGFSPSGEFCCSEADDKKYFESYNDAGGSGACFLGSYQKNNQLVLFNKTTHDDLYVYNGSVLGCGFNESNSSLLVLRNISQYNFSFDVPHLLDNPIKIEDWPNPGGGGNSSVAELFRTNHSLVVSSDYCAYVNDSKQGMYCSLNDNWTSAKGYVIHKSVVPVRLFNYTKNLTDANISSFGCCKKSECWDPLVGGCIASQLAYDAGYRVSNVSFFKCLNGGWVDILGGEKLTPDRCYSGFCSEPDQCLFDLFGDSSDNGNPDGSPQCLDDGQFKGVFVCNNGSWDSRTRLLALKLAGLVSSDDFSLSCGVIDDVVVLRQNPGLSDVFCTLKSGDVRVLGVLLNQPLIASDYGGFVDSLRQSFWLAYPGSGASFDVTKNCTPGTTNFSECLYAYATAPPKDLLRFYYDREFNMAVISTYDISPTLGQKICSVLPSWLQWLCPSEPEFKQLLKSVGGVEKVYLAKSGSKSVFGFGKNICPDPSLGLAWDYSFNYTGFGLGVVNVLKQGIIADYLIAFNSSIHVWNAHGDVWNSLALLKYE